MARAPLIRGPAGLAAPHQAALDAVRERAAVARAQRLTRIEELVAATGVATPELLAEVARQATLTLNFHPDRLLADGRSVARALRDEGVYRSQFETGISNGGLTAHPGGDRDVWEHELFAGAYHAPGVRIAERPKYGGCNVMNNLNGASPRFGSCHLRLAHQVLDRATLLYGDSADRRTDLGTADALEPVLAPLVEDLAAGRGAFGRAELDLPGFVTGTMNGDMGAGRGVFAPAMTNALGGYVEAQVHGEVALAGDAEAVVIDPAFAGTPDAELLVAAAGAHDLRVEWHAGTQLALAQVPRTAVPVTGRPAMRWELWCGEGRAHRLAEVVLERHDHGDRLDAAIIGYAAAGVVRDPEAWREWGPPADVLVQLKDLWFVLLALGEPPR